MEKRPLVICTDPGIDDFIALSMVLSKPEFDVLGMVALNDLGDQGTILFSGGNEFGDRGVF